MSMPCHKQCVRASPILVLRDVCGNGDTSCEEYTTNGNPETLMSSSQRPITNTKLPHPGFPRLKPQTSSLPQPLRPVAASSSKDPIRTQRWTTESTKPRRDRSAHQNPIRTSGTVSATNENSAPAPTATRSLPEAVTTSLRPPTSHGKILH